MRSVVFAGNIVVFGLILYYMFVVKKQMYGVLNSSILSRGTLRFALCRGIYFGMHCGCVVFIQFLGGEEVFVFC